MKKFLLLLALLPVVAQAQSSSGLLATNRAIDWSHAGAGTIPARATVCASLTSSASPSSVASALSSCTAGETVSLAAGTYNWSSSLITSASNVTLRGAGPTATILNFTGTSTNCNGIGPVAFCITNGDSGTMNFSANQCSITGGLSRGATSFTMGTCGTGALGNLKIGALVQLTANDEASDNGQWWACGSTGTTGDCSQQGSQNSWNGNTTTQMVTVTNISGSTITISPGIYAPDWASGRTLNALYSSTLPVTGFGIENLQVNTQSLGDIQAMVETQWVTNSWMKNVSLVNAVANNAAARKHAEIGSSTHFTIRDSYLYGSSPTSEAYGIDFTFGNADSLAENNICQHIATCTILENGMGNVFGYNYAVDNFYIGNPPGSAPNWQQCDATHHAAGDVYNLWEGHEGICAAADDIHGTAFANTIFRSYFNGHDPATLCPGGGTGCGTGPKNQDTDAFNFSSFNRYYNIALSVAGTAGGYFTTYQQQGNSGSPSSCPATNWTTLYNLNYGTGTLVPWSPACTGASFIIDNDPLVSTSLMRWGNYDVVNASVQTNSGETGSSASTYPGLSSPSTSYASYPSLYLSAKPAFFGSNPWPPIGPDVSGGPLPNGSKHNPAELCYGSLGGSTDGSTGSLGSTFDASTCYASTPNVATPTLSPTAGTFTVPQTVALSTATGGASIIYTTDGSTPTVTALTCTITNGLKYGIPVFVAASETVKAIGCLSGDNASSVASAAYVIPTPTIALARTEGSSANSPTRDAYTNCATSCSAGVWQPVNSGSVSNGQLACTTAAQSSGVANGCSARSVVGGTITGATLSNGLGAGGTDSLASLSISWSNALAGDCGTVPTTSALIPTLSLLGAVASSRSLFSGTTQGSFPNTSLLAPTKWAIPGGDADNYYVVQMCETVPTTTGTGFHLELDLNHTLSTDDYVGPGSHYDFSTSKWYYCPQGCSSWKAMNLVEFNGTVHTTLPYPAGHSLYMEWQYHRTPSCSSSSGSNCYFYDYACIQDVTAATPAVCGAWQDATSGLTPGGIPVHKAGFTTNQINVQHQLDFNAASSTRSVNSDFRNVTAFNFSGGTPSGPPPPISVIVLQ